EIAAEAQRGDALMAQPGWSRSDVRSVLTDLVAALEGAPEASATPIPEQIMRQLSRKRIALVGFAEEEAERVCGAMGGVTGAPYRFKAAESPALGSVRACDAVMIHVRPETAGSYWLRPGPVPAGRPWLFAGSREDLLTLDPAVQSRAAEFLVA